MRILLIGDPHLHNNYLQLSIDFLKWTEEIIADKDPDYIINLGDVFHSHAVIRSEVLCEFTDHLTRISKPYHLILGNHDQFKPNNSRYHALTPFKHFNKYIKVIDTTTIIDNHLYVPYINSPEEWPTNFAHIDIVFTHNTFVGAKVGNYTMEEGIESYPKNLKIISGHIHKKQYLNNVFYPGTPFATSANDVGQEKGLHILDTDTFELDFIRSPFPEWHRLDFDIDTMVLEDQVSQFRENDIIVLYTIGSKSQINSFLSSKELKTIQKNRKIQIKSTIIDNEKSKLSISNSIPIESMIKEYIKAKYNNIDIEDEIKEILDEFKTRRPDL